MQQVSPPFALASALLGLAALHCGPPVAQRPPPTPVYTSELSVPPTDITQESLGESAEDSKPEAAPEGESDGGCECGKAEPPPAEDEAATSEQTEPEPVDAENDAAPAEPAKSTAPLPR